MSSATGGPLGRNPLNSPRTAWPATLMPQAAVEVTSRGPAFAGLSGIELPVAVGRLALRQRTFPSYADCVGQAPQSPFSKLSPRRG